ncbi:hypothetical protein MMC24_005614 [Lignoscripta atroalba]|nr:hypothetical protein [Lignoscripta atroalba]
MARSSEATLDEFNDSSLIIDDEFLANKGPAQNEFEGASPSDNDSFAVERSSRTTFPFLKLPPEIRNRCYDLIFVSPKYIGSNGTQTKSFYKDAAKWRNLSFARSCRQIYSESGNIFFARNGFEFYYIRPFLEFLEAIGINRRRLLTKIRYIFSGGRPYVGLRYLRSCTNLQVLEIHIRVVMQNKRNSWWLYSMENAKDFFFTDFRGMVFGTAVGVGKAVGTVESPPLSKIALAKLDLVHALVKFKNEVAGKFPR